MWLFIAFIAVPLIEIALFIQVGGAIGLGWTLLFVVITAIIGTVLVRRQGLHVLAQVKSSFDELGDPSEPLAHGAMILFSGALLLTPGFFTDAVGFALLVPNIRSAVFHWARKRVHVTHFSTHSRESRGNPRSDTIEGEFSDVTDTTPSQSGPSGWTKH